MILTLSVSLYTSRIILNVLGIIDFGIFTIVGGVISLFTFFNAAMLPSTQRYLSFDIGRRDWINLHKTFNSSVIVHLGIALLILILGETVGLWFVNHKLNLPKGRMDVVNFVYQFSILTAVVSIAQVPYTALITARERMNAFAVLSIAEAFLKLSIVFLLYISPVDKLKSYCVLLFIVSIIIAIIYKLYCVKHFQESKFKLFKDKILYKELIYFSGWNLFGNIATVAKGQGMNVMLNMFFGILINATYGIMMQVQNAVGLFVGNFQMAVNPQILKSYALGDFTQTHKLISQSSKFSYFMLLIIACPLIFNIEFILNFWLIDPPKYTSIFVVLSIANLMIESISRPLMIGALAIGNIKWYQIIIGFTLFLNLPLSFMFYKLGFRIEIFLYVAIILSLVTLIFRLIYLNQKMDLDLTLFLKNVLFKIIIITFYSSIVLLFMNHFFNTAENFIDLLIISTLIIFIIISIVYLFGLSKSERKKVLFLLKIKSIG